ncbi:C3a anaphylatoxin chemotactic receptor isoform X2 [Gouania willdenowi]|uniref:C3a anaphylatoxin chemotactic receptor isoform X2 n=1 Tax=Gouania willdenowi TaxID=441366 RepID=UPI0010566EBF|nr:C3a anaphylatoxin chemotactic receptor-like isoform X2 [Gouania willdenowi]
MYRKDRERERERERGRESMHNNCPSPCFFLHSENDADCILEPFTICVSGTTAAVVYNMNATGEAADQSVSASSSSWQAEASKGIQITITLLIFLVGVPLNGLVVWALGLQRHRHLGRRGSGEETRAASSFRVYVLNLALADLVLLLRAPLMLGYISNNYSWPFGSVSCLLVMFLRGLGLYTSAFLLCAVALERCFCLLRPMWARMRRASWAVTLACGLLWLVAAIFSAPYLYFAVLKERNGTLQCEERGTFNMGLFLTETIAGFILPLLVFLGSNLAVLLSIRLVVPPTPTASPPTINHRMTRMYQVLFITMFLFLSCWVPYFVCRFLLAVADSGKTTLSRSALYGKYISMFLVYIKSALNPVLYVFAARGLGRVVKTSIVNTIQRLFSDDSSESIRRKSLKHSQT